MFRTWSLFFCRRAGFRRITLRGDTDFTQTKHLDRWDQEGHRFIFGSDDEEEWPLSRSTITRFDAICPM